MSSKGSGQENSLRESNLIDAPVPVASVQNGDGHARKRPVQSSISQYKFKSFLIDRSDIVNVIERIRQQCSILSQLEESMQIVVFFRDKSFLTFKSVEEFSTHENAKLESIDQVIVEVEISGRMPLHQEAETIEVRLACRTNIAQYEFNMIQYTGGDYPNNIKWDISFSNYIIANNIFNTVQEWVGALSSIESQNFFRKLRRHSYQSAITAFFAAVPLASSFIFILSFYIFIDRQHSGDFTIWMFGSVFLYVFLKIFMAIIRSKITKRINNICVISSFDITSGDKKRMSEALGENRSQVRKISLGLIAALSTLLISFFAGLASTYVYVVLF
ncbi:MAG: hypothetical protein NXI16_14335 [Alphaproteobacteria bacterium]|nr:hypothetical protein [Alphaproteobacteria bacterium]